MTAISRAAGDVDQFYAFMTTMFAGLNERHLVTTHERLPGRGKNGRDGYDTSRWSVTPERLRECAEDAVRRSQHADMYFRVTPMLATWRPKTKYARGDADESSAWPGYSQDVDLAVTKDGAYPNTWEEALERIVKAIPLPPSLVVGSGNGVHAHWLLEVPYVFTKNAGDYERARHLGRGLHAAIAAMTPVDPTFDLARMMRPVGTSSHKSDPPRPVTLLVDSGARYTLADLERYAVDAPHSTPATDIAVNVTTPSAEVTLPERAEILMANDTSTAEVFDRSVVVGKRRPDGTLDSSAYDFSLAVRMVEVGASDQDIADTIVAHRVAHKDDVGKATVRADYIPRTIRKARAAHARDVAELAAIGGEHDDGLDFQRRLLHRITIATDPRATAIELLQKHEGALQRAWINREALGDELRSAIDTIETKADRDAAQHIVDALRRPTRKLTP